MISHGWDGNEIRAAKASTIAASGNRFDEIQIPEAECRMIERIDRGILSGSGCRFGALVIGQCHSNFIGDKEMPMEQILLSSPQRMSTTTVHPLSAEPLPCAFPAVGLTYKVYTR
jgi:hypothetical protein